MMQDKYEPERVSSGMESNSYMGATTTHDKDSLVVIKKQSSHVKRNKDKKKKKTLKAIEIPNHEIPPIIDEPKILGN